jgi:hypothetical protein
MRSDDPADNSTPPARKEAAPVVPARPPGFDPAAEREIRIARRRVVAAAVVLYFLACATPVYELPDSRSVRGLEALLFGWLGPFEGIVAWYANPLFFLALLFFGGRRYRRACYCAFAALALGSTSLLLKNWPSGNMSGHGPGQGDSTIVSSGPGLWLWLGSMALVAGSALGFWLREAARELDRRAKLAGPPADPAAESD